MEQFCVKFNSIDQIKSFVCDATKINADIDIVYGKHIIDAKSLLGICSLDTSNVLTVKINTKDENEIEKFINMARKYGV